MKKIGLLIIGLAMVFALCAQEQRGFETNLTASEYLDIKENISYIIKKDLLKRYFIPGVLKEVVSENIEMTSSDGSLFTYALKTVTNSDSYYDALYNDIDISGKILSLIKTSSNNYELVLSIETKFTEEDYSYYGNKTADTYFKNDKITILFDTDFSQNIEKESNLYFVGITRKFSLDELRGLTLDELGYLRNEFYARKGYDFQTAKMKNYFSTKPWFKPITRNVTLTEIELTNVYLIRGMEQEIKLGTNSAEVEELNLIYEIAQRRPLTKTDIENVSPHKLPYLRNTFYAKKGYIFSVLRYKEYFEKQNWYVGTKTNVDNELSALDIQNIMFIKSNESQN